MISVITVYNNERTLNDWLLRSLASQKTPYQKILINNVNGKFKSAASALNYCAKDAKGDFLMFVHQDVRLLGSDWFKKAETHLKEIDNLGVAGVAGMVEQGSSLKERGRNVIYHYGEQRKKWEWGNSIDQPTKVQTLDGLLMIVPRNVFNKLKFDEATCPGWHLYDVDYALSIQKLGLSVYVLPLEVWHGSTTRKLDLSYFNTLRRISVKHRDRFNRIYTTMGEWDISNPAYTMMYAIKYYMGSVLRLFKQFTWDKSTDH